MAKFKDRYVLGTGRVSIYKTYEFLGEKEWVLNIPKMKHPSELQNGTDEKYRIVLERVKPTNSGKIK